ncbi:MAG: outer membrane lipoprotein carrier protein LolA [Sedimentisphaeraceae bacterium JB056]
MRSANDIKKIIKNTKINVDSNVSEFVLDDILSRMVESENVNNIKQSRWRIIMKYKITEVAAAVIVVIAAVVGINYLGGSVDVASVAWSQVVEQLSNHQRYKCRQRVVRENGQQMPVMDVYHMNLSLRRQEVEDGSIHIIDMRGKDAITVELYPEQKRAVVTKLLDFGPKKDPDIIDMVKRFEQKSTERLGTKEADGEILQGFKYKPNEYNDFTVWVDSETKLPVEIELLHPKSGQTIFLDEFEFDFELAPSAFSTEIPDGYKVETIVNNYGPSKPKKVSEQDIKAGLNHSAYLVEERPWVDSVVTFEILSPLGEKTKVYTTAIKTTDGNLALIVQGNYYDITKMVWLSEQDVVLETPEGIKLHTHPNGAIYAKLFLEGFVKANPGYFDPDTISEERFTLMAVMPDGVVLGIVANNKMDEQRLQKLVDSLSMIEAAQ